MNPINNPIRECLEKWEIRISSRSKLITIVLKNNGTVLERVESQKGIRHAFLVLLAKVAQSKKLEAITERLYPYPLGPTTTTELDHFVLDGRYIRIYFWGSLIQIDAHQTTMPYPNSEPGPYYKRGTSRYFGQAIKDMLRAEPTSELLVLNPI